MSVQEGARIMKRAGQWTIMIPLTVVLLLSPAMFTMSFVNRSSFAPDLILFICLFFLIIPSGALWLAGWIVEGFAKKEGP